MTTTDIEVRLKPEQWRTLANMLARAAAVSDVHKSPSEQARDKEQARKMRDAVQKCLHEGCAMSASLERWRTFLATGERLAKHGAEWSALKSITEQLSPAACAGDE